MAALLSMTAHAQRVDEAPIGESAERHLPSDVDYMQWMQDPERVATEEGDTLEQREMLVDRYPRLIYQRWRRAMRGASPR